ncbi:molybdopterin-dependent oxidoreductase [Dyella silvae]|uniref:molybdopterin-dependent oxidoreductase n=1 Tax=Dyella silvae TaxID=2994424 RepID=UPI0022652067|nr:molybdopterin-dependent oxidoreductase [Dyella silvae]
MRPWVVGGFLCCMVLSAYAGEPASGLLDPPVIKLSLDGKPAYSLDRAALAAFPRTTVKTAANGEPQSAWQGVALEDIVERVCVASGDSLYGRALARFVRVTAANGAQVVFSAAELAPDYGKTEVILADTKDGKPLEQGAPFRLVVPGDKRTDRWISHVTAIEVVDASTP